MKYLVYVLFFVVSLNIQASEDQHVELNIKDNLIGIGVYNKGEIKKKAVLIIHGFLATNRYSTINLIKESYEEMGYTTLAPILTLGISKRNSNLSCKAIQTHTMKESIFEISKWVTFLESKGINDITIIGHSTGVLKGLSYIDSKYKSKSIKRFIGASIIDFKYTMGNDLYKKQVKMATNLIKRHRNNLREYTISYCKKFVASPKTFMSYVSWSKNKFEHALLHIKVPSYIIVGLSDDRARPQWSSQLKKSGVNIIQIKDANHFFANGGEFNFSDAIYNIMEK